MKKRQHTTEQIIRKLEEGDRRLAEGMTVDEVCKHLEITPSTWFRRRNQFGGLKADDAKELRELRKENGRLKKIVADQALDIDISGDRPGKLLTSNRRRAAVTRLEERFGGRATGVCGRRPGPVQPTSGATRAKRRRAEGVPARVLSAASALGLATGPGGRPRGRLRGQPQEGSSVSGERRA